MDRTGDRSREGDEQSLVARARTDPAAFAELYRRHADGILRFAHRRTGSRTVAEDVTAATFERAWRNLHQFRDGGDGIGPWLYRIAANQLADHHGRVAVERSPRRLGAAAALSSGRPDDPVDRVVDGDAFGPLRTALDGLHPRYRRAVELCYLAELDHAEAAAAMGVSRATMRVVLHRALAQLRRRLTVDDLP